MKEINKESKSKSRQPLKVVVVNPPTKEKAKEMIKKISEELSKVYSNKIREEK